MILISSLAIPPELSLLMTIGILQESTHINLEMSLQKKDLPQTMEAQSPNLCVTSIMAYAYNKVFGGNKDEGEFILYYWNTYNENPMYEGVSLEHIGSFVNTFFKVESALTLSYTQTIDNGYVAMTDIPSNIQNSRHNILALGYQLLMNLSIYMDPEKGEWYCVSPTYFCDDYYFILSGIK